MAVQARPSLPDHRVARGRLQTVSSTGSTTESAVATAATDEPAPAPVADQPAPHNLAEPTGVRGRIRRARAGLPARLIVAAAAGGLLVLAFPPYGAWPLAAVSVAALTALLRGQRLRPGFAIGLVFGLAFFVPLLRWTGIYVGPAPWLILAGAQAVYLGLLGAALTLSYRLPAWPAWAAALWVAEEALRDRAPFGGFPWGRLAFAESNSPLAWFAAWGGAPLVSFAVALTGGLLAALGWAAASAWRPRRPTAGAAATGTPDRPPAPDAAGTPAAPGASVAPGDPAGRPPWHRHPVLRPAIGLVALVAVAALAHPPAPGSGGARTVRVALVQGNVPRLGLDFNAQREAVLRNHVQRTLDLAGEVKAGRQPQPQLVIWPENASDIDPFGNPDAGALIDQAAQAIGVPILVGAVLDGPGPDHTTNAGIVWDPVTGPGQRYVKRHPVPFGEYIPLRKVARLVSKDVDLVGRDMVAGGEPGRLRVGPVELGDVICFEVAYDGIVRDAAQGTGLLVVQTNNATFGRSDETYQQLAMSRLRAIEHGQTVLVAATSGVSAIITPDGQVLDRSAVFTPDLLAAAVPVRAGSTLATRLGALPEWLLVAVAGAALVTAAAPAIRARRADRARPTPKEQEQP
jgi:apolipoprotein N-acyltransferase